MKRLTFTLLGLGLLASASLAQGKYSVPAPRAVTATWEAAEAALTAGDVDAAAHAIQELLDAGPGELVEVRPHEWVGAREVVREWVADPTTPLARAVAAGREAEAAAELAELQSAAARLDTSGRAALAAIAWRHPGTQAHVAAELLRGDLAFERGELEGARGAWQAGLDAIADRTTDPLSAPLAARLEATAGLVASVATTTPAETLDAMIEGRWSVPVPAGHRDRYIDFGDLRPTPHDGRVFINTGLELLAFHAASGQRVWSSGEPSGWETLSSWKRRELFKGVALNDLTNQAATNGRVVVGALQLPFTENKNDNIDGLTITVSLPERRLFALDADTGERLWDHAPSEAERLSGAQLGFPKRARIAAPPSIQGDLVVVPSYELVGRINLYVTAYDLETGALVWNRLIVSGQTRVNLFGEHEAEFNAAPLAIADGRVFVSSNLGVVSALDLATGHPLWTEEYRRYELPRTNGYYTPNAQRRWHNGPPLVAGERFAIAPIDSPDILFGDVAKGVSAALEGNDLEGLADPESSRVPVDIDHLVRLTEERLWIGGDHLCAFDLTWTARGVEARRAWAPVRTPGPNDAYNSPSPRARVLDAGRYMYAATEFRLVAVDPASGESLELGPIDSDAWLPGNLAIESGRMLVLTDEALFGWVNWDAVIAENQARLAAGDLTPAARARTSLDLGRAFLARWEARGERPEDLADARRELMGKTASAWVDAGHVGLEELRSLRFALLGAEAEVHTLAGKTRAANDSLLEALAFAPFASARLTVRFRQLEVLGVPVTGEADWRTKARRDVLEALLADHPRDVVDDDLADALGLPYELDELLGRFAPGLVALADELGTDVFEVAPLGFLALAALAEDAEANATRTSDWRRALERWHDALWDYGDLPAPSGALFGPTLRDWLLVRIDRVLAQPEGARGYVDFEAAAEARVAKAEALEDEARINGLAAVASRYPHSAAAARVTREMIDLTVEALGAGADRARFADLARMTVPRSTASADERSSHARLALARGAAAIDEPELAALLAARLAELDGRFAGLLPDAGLAWPGAPARRDFHGPSTTGQGNYSVRLGNYLPIGPVPVPPNDKVPGGEVMLAGSTSGELMAFLPGARGDLIWTLPIGNYSNAPWKARVHAATDGESDVLVVQADNGLFGIDPRRGTILWDHSPFGRRPHSIAVADGLLTTLWSGDEPLLEARSASSGLQLWTYKLGPRFDDSRRAGDLRVIRAGTRLVVIGPDSDIDPLVLDATSGQLLGHLTLPEDATRGDLEHAWAAGGHLFLPRVLGGTGERTNVVHAFDIMAASNLPVFALALAQGQEIAGILHAPSGTYLWLIDVERNVGDKNALVQVNAELGALRRVATLEPSEIPAGLDLGASLELEADFVITAVSNGRHGGLRLRGVGLPLGSLWTTTVAAPARSNWDFDTTPLPAPLVASETATLLYALSSDDPSSGQEVHALVLDRSTGRSQEDRVLSSRLGRLSSIELDGVADELFLFGGGTWGSNRGRLEILVPRPTDSR